VEDFVVVEAGDRVGGRVCSDRVREGGSLVELGAQWIHGEEGNVVYDLARQFGLLSSEEGSGSVNDSEAIFLWEDGSQVREELVEQMMMAFASIEEDLEKQTPTSLSTYPNLGQYYTTALQTQLTDRCLPSQLTAEAGSYLQWYARLQASIDGAPTCWDTAVHQNMQYVECGGNQTVTLGQGNTYQGLLERMGEKVMDRVKLGEKVLKVRHGDRLEGVEVETSETVYKADFVIVTLSLGVLKTEAEKMFDPPLPEKKMEVVNRMGFGTIAKVFVEFPVEITEVLPDIKPAGFNFLRREEGFTPHQNTPSIPWLEGVFGLYPDQSDPRLLVAWLTGPAALQAETLPPKQVLSSMSALISAVLSPSLPHLPLPISTTVTSWGGSPLSQGSYSYLTPSTPADAHSTLTEPVGRVLWAGEATHSTHFSTVHGAVESGWREADRVLNMTMMCKQ